MTRRDQDIASEDPLASFPAARGGRQRERRNRAGPLRPRAWHPRDNDYKHEHHHDNAAFGQGKKAPRQAHESGTAERPRPRLIRHDPFEPCTSHGSETEEIRS